MSDEIQPIPEQPTPIVVGELYRLKRRIHEETGIDFERFVCIFNAYSPVSSGDNSNG